MGHPGDLKNLNELDDYQVGADDADPRGWQVTATDGRGIGRVADLIVDTDSMKVRYLDVEVDRALSPNYGMRGLRDSRTLAPDVRCCCGRLYRRWSARVRRNRGHLETACS